MTKRFGELTAVDQEAFALEVTEFLTGLGIGGAMPNAIALTAATYDNMPGRSWKALSDTTNDPVVSMRRP